MDKKYTKIIHGVENMDGTCPYLIGSDKPLPEALLEELNKTYISIHLLSYLWKKHGFFFEVYEEVYFDLNTVQNYLSIILKRETTQFEKSVIEKWIMNGFSFNKIRKAFELSIKARGKIDFNYVDALIKMLD